MIGTSTIGRAAATAPSGAGGGGGSSGGGGGGMNSSGGGGRIGRFGRMTALLAIAAATVPMLHVTPATPTPGVAKHTATVRPTKGLPAVTKLQLVTAPTAATAVQGNGPSPGATVLTVVSANATGFTPATPTVAPAGVVEVRVQVALPVIVA